MNSRYLDVDGPLARTVLDLDRISAVNYDRTLATIALVDGITIVLELPNEEEELFNKIVEQWQKWKRIARGWDQESSVSSLFGELSDLDKP